MNRHQHPTNNDVLGAPPGVPLDECTALPITRVIWQDTGGHGVVSYWLPTAEELALMETLDMGKPINKRSGTSSAHMRTASALPFTIQAR